MEEFLVQLETLPKYLSAHLLLSMFALVVGMFVSIPLGIYATRNPRLEKYILAVVSVVQTIPSLALLGLMVPLMGGTIGWMPALVALSLYSMLPILTNTITGIHEVDRSFVEAGRGTGMTESQLLMRVILPLALPVIVAGIRTSIIWVVGTATLATPVGGDSLGYYIFLGLNTRTTAVIVFGCCFSAFLAIILDRLTAGIEKALRERKQKRARGFLVALIALAVSGMLAPWVQRHLTHTKVVITQGAGVSESRLDEFVEEIVVGAKDFTEQYILAELIATHLRKAGYRASTRTGLGLQIYYDGLDAGTLDVVVDYSGTIWATVMKQTDLVSPESALIKTSHYLLEKRGTVALGPLGFDNAYAFGMLRKRADELGIHSVSDLAVKAGELIVAGDFSFFGRVEGRHVMKSYGLKFKEQRHMNSRLMYDALASGAVDVVTAYTSDGQIGAFDVKILEDPKGAFPPYDAMLVMSAKAAKRPGLVRRLRQLVNKIGREKMIDANRAVDMDGESVPVVAERLLKALEPLY